jgi:hypothetical protein
MSRSSEGERICARIFKRLDGTVMTKDCTRGYAFGWQLARKALPRLKGPGLIVVVLLALTLGVISQFGDNIRRLFAMSSDGGLGPEPIAAAPTHPPKATKRMANFGEHNSY